MISNVRKEAGETALISMLVVAFAVASQIGIYYIPKFTQLLNIQFSVYIKCEDLSKNN